MSLDEALALGLHLALLLVLPPLLLGVINKTKAVAAGRQGPPLLQAYRDVAKLLRKGAVYSRTATLIFRAGPIVALACVMVAGLVLPLASRSAPLGFAGDVIVFAYLLGLGRMFTMLAALDTGSSFEGMGASREAAFAALTEPALLLALAIVCVPAQSVSFSETFADLPWASGGATHPAFPIAAGALFVVLLAENARIPVDDPNTHLELTMVHEVMVLDHGGPDFAAIVYGSAVKLFVLGALLLHVLFVFPTSPLTGALLLVGGQLVIAVLVGVAESILARLRLSRVPQLLLGATILAVIGLGTVLYGGGQ